MTRRPDFFIIGAPKCGTTALSEYLRGHPAVFFSHPKEPHFFNEDFANRHTTRLDDYLKCFQGVQASHEVIGEGSVFYLMSRVAVPRILEFSPTARFIVMLRNPVDMSYSWHSQAMYAFGEDVADFESAWRLQAQRREGQGLPRHCREPKTLLYRDICLLGEQLSRLYNHVDRNKVKTVFFEDFVNDTRAIYEAVLSFLGIASDGREHFERVNPSKKLRSVAVERLMHRAGACWAAAKRHIGIDLELGFGESVRRMNTRKEERSPLRRAFREELHQEFAQDVAKLSALTGRDLSAWLAE